MKEHLNDMLFDMNVGELITREEITTSILRVPGGWIFNQDFRAGDGWEVKTTFVPEPTWVPSLDLMQYTIAILDEKKQGDQPEVIDPKVLSNLFKSVFRSEEGNRQDVTSREMTTQTTVELLCRMAEHPMFSSRLKFTPQGFVLFPENSMVMEGVPGQDPTRP